MLQTVLGLARQKLLYLFFCRQPVSAPSLPGTIKLGSRLPWSYITLGFLEFDHIHT